MRAWGPPFQQQNGGTPWGPLAVAAAAAASNAVKWLYRRRKAVKESIFNYLDLGLCCCCLAAVAAAAAAASAVVAAAAAVPAAATVPATAAVPPAAAAAAVSRRL